MTKERAAGRTELCIGWLPALLILVFTAVVATFGCQPAGLDVEPSNVPAPSAAALNLNEGEVWDIIQISGKPVGYQTTSWRTTSASGQETRHVSNRSVFKMLRFGQATEESIRFETLEDVDGQLRSFSSEVSSGGNPIRTTAKLAPGQVDWTMEASGKSQSWTTAQTELCGGPFAPEFSLIRDPLLPGQKRDLVALVPVLNGVALIRLQANDFETVQLFDHRSESLLRILVTSQYRSGDAIQSVIWCDRLGQVMKSSVPAMSQDTFRVTKEQALSQNGAALDMGTLSIVRVEMPIPDPVSTRRIEYKARLKNGNPADVFAQTPYQTVRSTGERTGTITVTRVRPDSAASSGDEPPGDADRNASAMIQSDDPGVQQLAASIADTGDPWGTAVQIEKFVHGYLTQKNFSTAFATAADVVRARSGDCTEHAVLTAALCRARGIPARVVVGLVYVPAMQGFGFHMWNEVWIGEQWIPIDSTIGQGGIGAAHLALSRAPLDGGDSFVSFLPVVQVLGQLDLEIVSLDEDRR